MKDDLKPIPRIPSQPALAMVDATWPGRFEMKPISALRIRKSYQRDLTKKSARVAIRIAKEFCWSKFGCLIIRSAGPGIFEVIDGQHRATAALLAGVESVPAIIVDGAAADTFLGINRTRTSLTPLAIFSAERAAGEANATKIAEAAAMAGVIIRRNSQQGHLPPGELVAIGAVRTVLKDHGLKALRTVFRGLRRSEADASPLTPSIFTAANIRAAALILAEHPDARDAVEDAAANILADMFHDFDAEALRDEIDLERLESGVTAYKAQARVMLRRAER